MTYGGYLGLDELLAAQHPISTHHDELLFIIIHQTKELWLKQTIHELKLARELVRADTLDRGPQEPVARVADPGGDDLELGRARDADADRLYQLPRRARLELGFQSAQFREVEYLLGLKDGSHLGFQDEGSAQYQALAEALAAPSLWDEANAALARAGFELPADVLERDWSQPYEPDPAVEAAWAEVYRDTERWWPLLSARRETGRHRRRDGDLAAQACRDRVERIIGMKRGTGGTAGRRLSPVDPVEARLPRIMVAAHPGLIRRAVRQ